MLNEIRVGSIVSSDGGVNPARADKQGAIVSTDAHGRFTEANYRGAIFSAGQGLFTINAATFTTATLGATCTPIIGIWNPLANLVNAIINQATLVTAMTALQATGAGPFAWATAVGQSAITTGVAAFNRKTLLKSGSNVVDVTNVALTGLVGNLAVRFGSAMGGGSALAAAFLATAVAMQTQLQGYVENFDGSLIVPPGGVIALLATTTPVAHSVTSSLMWEEQPV